jgi:hypothetical protein
MDLVVKAYQVVARTPRYEYMLWKDMIKEGMLDSCLIATNPKFTIFSFAEGTT